MEGAGITLVLLTQMHLVETVAGNPQQAQGGVAQDLLASTRWMELGPVAAVADRSTTLNPAEVETAVMVWSSSVTPHPAPVFR